MTSIAAIPPIRLQPGVPRRSLVTGGAGFIGSHIVNALLARGDTVLVLDDLSSGHAANIPANVELVCADINSELAAAAIHTFRPDVLLHVAAQPSVAVSVERPLHDARVNVLGGMAIAHAALSAGVRVFLYVNTGGALYGRPRYLPVDEDHPIEPLSPYGLSKWTLENYLRLLVAPRMPLKVLRLANVYGPRQDPAGEAGVVAVFASRMLAGQSVTIHGDGEQTRDFVYVSDVARAALLALEEPGEITVNVSTGEGASVNELFARVASLTGYTQAPQRTASRPGDVRHSVLANTRARSQLGWWPMVSFDEGLGQVLSWMRARERTPLTAPIS